MLAALMMVAAVARARAADVTVLAAASLTNALTDIGKAWERKTGRSAVFSFAASSALARQIAHSQGADIFISADIGWMDYLERRGLIARGTRENLLGNTLVLIAPSDSKTTLKIAPHFNLLGALHGGRLALANPDSVPAGEYAKAALISLGVWSSVVGHLAPAENVRAALAYVARGETPLGIVYASGAKIEPAVRVIGAFPANSHPPIVYPAALTKGARPLAKNFLAYLSGPEARAIFQKDGFTAPAPRR